MSFTIAKLKDIRHGQQQNLFADDTKVIMSILSVRNLLITMLLSYRCLIALAKATIFFRMMGLLT
jgi:hypothetical protein